MRLVSGVFETQGVETNRLITAEFVGGWCLCGVLIMLKQVVFE
jgi:hypothetical protein